MCCLFISILYDVNEKKKFSLLILCTKIILIDFYITKAKKNTFAGNLNILKLPMQYANVLCCVQYFYPYCSLLSSPVYI